MEAGREPLHRGESCYHQPLELASGPHLGLGVPHPTADRHLQTDPRQQGQSRSLMLDMSVCVCVYVCSYVSDALAYVQKSPELFDELVA